MNVKDVRAVDKILEEMEQNKSIELMFKEAKREW